ncbi:tagatose-6-phosphate kinase [Arthrobacter sp. Hiyo8]|nr:tagatose-6-phosphate kinase [Arthrobacter sp. Hiyo8]
MAGAGRRRRRRPGRSKRGSACRIRSLPPGAPADFYPALVRLAHDAGIPAVVDTSGPGIIAAARAGADLLKPNNHELLEATGKAAWT